MFNFNRDKESDKYRSASYIEFKKKQREQFIGSLIDTLDSTMSFENRKEVLETTFDMIDRMIEEKFLELRMYYEIN